MKLFKLGLVALVMSSFLWAKTDVIETYSTTKVMKTNKVSIQKYVLMGKVFVLILSQMGASITDSQLTGENYDKKF